jgi:hypothetical protein
MNYEVHFQVDKNLINIKSKTSLNSDKTAQHSVPEDHGDNAPDPRKERGAGGWGFCANLKQFSTP